MHSLSYIRRRSGGRQLDMEVVKAIPILVVAKDLGFKLSASGTGRCILPGHEDRNPSFSARAATNSFTCFACGHRGSVIDLAMIVQDMSFHSACEWLAQRYLGRTAKARTPALHRQPAAPLRAQGPVTLPDPEIYEWLVANCPLAQRGRAYLYGRGIGPEVIERFRVGQVGDASLVLRNAERQWGRERLARCGILSRTTQTRLIFPSGSLLFPFLSRSSISYLQARSIDLSSQRRWICPLGIQPPIFNSDALEGAHETLFICEGVSDVLSAAELGWEAIGFVGAAAARPVRWFAGLNGKNANIVGDADAAGKRFAASIEKELGSYGITAFIKKLPAGINDLNEYLMMKRGTAG